MMDEVLRGKLLSMKWLDDKVQSDAGNIGLFEEQNHAEVLRVHRVNALSLGKIMDDHGWPGATLVGADGMYAAWQVAKSANYLPSLQRKFLVGISFASANGEVPARLVAFLLDQVRFNQCEPQKYGTLLDWMPNGELGAELEDSKQVDEWRRLVGLPSYQQSISDQYAAMKLDQHRPNIDFVAYQELRFKWSQSVGWID